MSGCRESCDSADEVREAFNTNDIDGTHNIPNDHDVHSGRTATVLTGVLCALPSILHRGWADARQIAADYV